LATAGNFSYNVGQNEDVQILSWHVVCGCSRFVEQGSSIHDQDMLDCDYNQQQEHLERHHVTAEWTADAATVPGQVTNHKPRLAVIIHF